MPSIAGIISRRPASECQPLVQAMVEIMKPEPDCESGNYAVPQMGIHCGWVGVANSCSDGGIHVNETSDVGLVFSGYACPDPATLAHLKQKGHRLGDREGSWLVHLYEERGEEFFNQLNGLFSGLLIDQRRQRAYLFNDRFGIQRIYLHQTSDALYFASEAKALLRILPGLRAFDREGIADYLTFGCVLDWRTLFHGIQVLPGGSLWSFENGECHKGAYFSPETWEAQPTLSAPEYESQFQSTFKRILPRYFTGGSKIGIALTGGLDTRMIMACRPPEACPQTTYTFSGVSGRTLDDRIAAHVASASGLDHRLLRLGPDFFSNFAAHADKTVFVTDGCCGVAGAHEIYFNRQARELASVRLTGNYGSEILRGISTFKPISLSSQLLNLDLGMAVNSQLQKLTPHKFRPLTFAAFREIPWNLFGTLAAGRSQVNFRTPYLDNDLVALAYQAPDSVRKSPMPSLRLIQANSPSLSAIPTDRGFTGAHLGITTLFRRAFAEVTFKCDYYHNEGLPRIASPFTPVFMGVTSRFGLIGLHKSLHYARWFRSELASYLRDAFAALNLRQNRFWNANFLPAMVNEHLHGSKNYGAEINAVLTLEAVDRLLFRELKRGI